MAARKPLPALAAIALVLCAALSPFAQAAPATSHTSTESTLLKALLRSRELWATIDVCNPTDQPDTVGVRGSMPGDKQAHDQMYMSFRLQFQDATTKLWYDLPTKGKPSKPKLVHVGPGASVRQGGRSFLLEPQPGRPAVTLRGLVEFQWRRGSHVIQTATRPTTTGHVSLAGADPAGYAASGCLIG